MALKVKGKKVETAPKPLALMPSPGLGEVIAAIHKEKGQAVIIPGNATPVILRLPTGIFEFDFYIGGGFPKGRYSIVYGMESSCKTNIALKAIAVAQSEPAPCNKAVFVNLEQSYDPAWAAKLGVDTENLAVINPGYGEEAVDLIDAVTRASDVNVIVVDSIAALVANKEIGQSVETADVGSSALLIKRLVNKLMYSFSHEAKRGHFPCVILINQIRYKPMVQFGDPMTMPGGEAQKFLSSLRVYLYGKNEVVKDLNPDVPAFKDVHALIKKAKVPVRAVDFNFKMCMFPHNGMDYGDTNSFNMVSSHLKDAGCLLKDTKGWRLVGLPAMKFYNGGAVFATLTEMGSMYQENFEFRIALQRMVQAHYKKEIFVEEQQQGPQVLPGTAVVTQIGAGK